MGWKGRKPLHYSNIAFRKQRMFTHLNTCTYTIHDSLELSFGQDDLFTTSLSCSDRKGMNILVWIVTEGIINPEIEYLLMKSKTWIKIGANSKRWKHWKNEIHMLRVELRTSIVYRWRSWWTAPTGRELRKSELQELTVSSLLCQKLQLSLIPVNLIRNYS